MASSVKWNGFGIREVTAPSFEVVGITRIFADANQEPTGDRRQGLPSSASTHEAWPRARAPAMLA